MGAASARRVCEGWSSSPRYFPMRRLSGHCCDNWDGLTSRCSSLSRIPSNGSSTRRCVVSRVGVPGCSVGKWMECSTSARRSTAARIRLARAIRLSGVSRIFRVGALQQPLGDHFLQVPLDELAWIEIQHIGEFHRPPRSKCSQFEDRFPKCGLSRSGSQRGHNPLDLSVEPPPIRGFPLSASVRVGVLRRVTMNSRGLASMFGSGRNEPSISANMRGMPSP